MPDLGLLQDPRFQRRGATRGSLSSALAAVRRTRNPGAVYGQRAIDELRSRGLLEDLRGIRVEQGPGGQAVRGLRSAEAGTETGGAVEGGRGPFAPIPSIVTQAGQLNAPLGGGPLGGGLSQALAGAGLPRTTSPYQAPAVPQAPAPALSTAGLNEHDPEYWRRIMLLLFGGEGEGGPGGAEAGGEGGGGGPGAGGGGGGGGLL